MLVVHDELNRQLNTSVRFFDLSDLGVPTLLSTWVGKTRAIDHNGFVRGNRYYMSHYTRGMTVLDISDTANPKEIGHFDTYPVTDSTSFNGASGIYHYLPSGNILVSDINSGLCILGDNTLKPSQGSISFLAQNYTLQEDRVTRVAVTRQGGKQGNVSVKWELIAGTTDSDDVSMRSGNLAWSAGQDQAKEIAIPVSADTNNNDEPREQFFIRLHDPKGSLALTSPSIAILCIPASQWSFPPSADAGEDVTITPGQQVALMGSAEDKDSCSMSYLWQQQSGETVILEAADSASTQFTAPDTLGTLVFQLTATDRYQRCRIRYRISNCAERTKSSSSS